MDNGFTAACPNGNTLIDAFRENEGRHVPCRECDDTGFIPATREEIREVLRHRSFEWERRFGERPPFYNMVRWYRHLRAEGRECPECNGGIVI